MKKSMLIAILLSAFILPTGVFAVGGSYRDKHGNKGTITFCPPIVNRWSKGSGIDYTVPYTVTDSEGNKCGQFTIRSQMLPGRDPDSNDFVLNVLVSDNATQKAAELVIRNNPNVSPLAPILRLLDCSCCQYTEHKRYDNPKWGCWIIQDQADIANYPIELLDTRVIIHLLDAAQLAQLPNSDDGTGNWAEIMENHRTNFNECRFRADIDHLGEPQSFLLTSRIIAELDLPVPNTDADWLDRHSDDRGDCNFGNQQTDPGTGFCIGIRHGELSFMTAHRALIEDMTTELFNNNTWPMDFSFPFGRMPIWLVDPDSVAGPDSGEPFPDFHALPTHWERVKDGQGPLNRAGCWHDWPLDGYTPTLSNGDVNLGQYEAADFITPNGFVDRPCTDPADYFVVGIDGTIAGELEGAWHNGIHPFIGGSFSPPGTTAGTMVFWAFHTYSSTNTLANWRHAQKRDMGTPWAATPCVSQRQHVHHKLLGR